MENAVSLPDHNRDGYALCFLVENTLRELLIEKLTALEGPHWYKRRLPGDVLGKYKAALAIQRSSSWLTLIPHHPIYYVDFPDLRKVIEQSTNWSDCFARVFPRKEIFCASLQAIEPTRNAVAHNRLLSDSDVAHLVRVNNYLKEALGPDFSRYRDRTTVAQSIKDQLADLHKELLQATTALIDVRTIPGLATWNRVSVSWWFDDTYLSVDLSPLQQAFRLLKSYAEVPRRRGSGHVIQHWLVEHHAELHLAKAQATLEELLGRRL